MSGRAKTSSRGVAVAVVPLTPVQRRDAQFVYELAEEMSHAGHYGMLDDQGNYLGVDPRIEAIIERFRTAFGLSKIR